MAPEYLVRGQLTEKADIYSFGVLILEIVCGRRNSSFTENSTPLLQTVRFMTTNHIRREEVDNILIVLMPQVWDLYKSGRLSEAIDSCLNKDYPAKEAMDVLQIGLLCTQALASLRPSMATVVKLLSSEGERKVSIPEQPPFLNPCGASRRSCRVSSLVSKLEVSSGTSTDSGSSSSSSNLPSRTGDLTELNPN